MEGQKQDARRSAERLWQEQACDRLRKHYAEQATLPGHADDEPKADRTLSLAQLQRLFRCVLCEGYGL